MYTFVDKGARFAKTLTIKEVNKGIYIAFSESYPPTLDNKTPPKIIPNGGDVTITEPNIRNLFFGSSIKRPYCK